MDLGTAASGEHLVGATLLVPLGACEQHGAHLALAADSLVAGAVCERVAVLLAERDPGRRVLVAPTLEYGASGEHEGFAGTVSIGTEALRLVLVELVRSARRWCGPVVLVTGHGGNAEAVAAATRRLRWEGHDVGWTSCAEPGWDAHAGRAETSLVLALAPDAVSPASAVPGATAPLPELLPRLRAGGVAAVTATGVLGDPRGASAAEGRSHLTRVAERVTAQVLAADVDEHGRLVRPAPAGVPG
ncbi:mycofactocin biosynthesis peptidyl-dipeptidase MftE [Arthrobacter sp. NEB 688]|uniref:mycofactocin biosynthesis peptidyl-dipeptidase MftE n=1 Tax=Arthrobacter sp. NEB 688 TaxID=904039 RepID=UPI001563C832|nr:mycofactocin biosynthesis peptidyl-dipeptidase MftE [Arthrobacter sp. NEB 688]QKE83879.1 mycofactocin biosynthesis peptidyl-dipeptidase MftE [Arthrobacter sp. NEB 688]